MRSTFKKRLGQFGTFVVLCGLAWQGLFSTAAADDQTWVLKGATIHPMNGQPAFVGSVVIRGDQIEAVGKEVAIPEGAKVVALDGMHLTPGLIESRGKLWLTDAGTSESASKAELNVLDAIDPWSQDWRELAAQGITAVQVQPGSTGTLGGYGAVLRVGPMDSIDDLTLQAKSSVQAALGTKGATSKDRFAQYKALEKLLETAKKELDKQAAAEKKKAAEAPKKPAGENSQGDQPETQRRRRGRPPGRTGGATQEDDDKKPEDGDDEAKSESESSADTATTSLVAVLKREIPLHLEVHHADALAHALALAEKYNFRLVLDGLSDVNRLADELRQAGNPVVVGPLVESGARPSYRRDNDRQWLAELAEKPGQPWALSSFSAKGLGDRLLRFQAAQAVADGVAPEAALSAITVFPARMLGVAGQVGTIEKGKQADIAVFAGDPLNPAAAVRLVMCGGKVTYEQEVAVTSPVSEATSEPPQLPDTMPARYAVKSSRVLRDGQFSEQTLIVTGGQITIAAGQIPDDVPVFDFGDHLITPGLVNAHSVLGQSSIVTDSTESDVSHLAALDAIDPTTDAAQRMLAGGFIHVGVAPGTANTSAGLVGHLRLGSADGAVEPALAGQLVLLESARNRERFPASLAGQRMLLQRLLSGQAQPSPIYLSDNLAEVIAEQKQSNLQALADGKRPTVILADSDAELETALQLIEQFKLRAVLASRGRLSPFQSRLKELGVTVLVPALKGDEYQVQLAQYAELDQADIHLLLAGDDPQSIRQTAALLASAGVRPTTLRQSLADLGAANLGMKSTGLDSGSADFVVWNGDPLNTASLPVAVFVDGQPQDLETLDTQE